MKFQNLEVRSYYSSMSGNLSVAMESSDSKSNIMMIALDDLQCKIILDALEPLLLRLVKDEMTKAAKEAVSFRSLLPAPMESQS